MVDDDSLADLTAYSVVECEACNRKFNDYEDQ